MLGATLLTPSEGSTWGDFEPTPYSYASRASSSLSVPASFKAAKRRKTPQFIREESRRLRTPTEITRRVSQVDPELLEDPDTDKLIAGVARLVFRLIMEEGQPCSPQSRRDLASVAVEQPRPRLRESDFNSEVFFSQPRRWWRDCRWRRCCWRNRGEADLPDLIFRLLRDCIVAGHFAQDLVVVCAVYIERFVALSGLRVTRENWQPLLLAALLLASKVFEDIHPWNVDYVAILWKAAGLKIKERLSIYRLEANFLRGLRWRACISGEVFAAYYFSLKEADAPPSPAHRHEYGDSIRRCSSWCGPGAFGLGRMAEIPESTEEGTFAGTREASGSGSCSPLSAESSFCAQLRGGGDGHGSAPEWRSERSSQRRPSLTAPAQASESLVASFPPGCKFPIPEVLSMEDLPWTDRRNPLIGTFRHAPHAEPPSRRINPRLSAPGAGHVGLTASLPAEDTSRYAAGAEPGLAARPCMLRVGSASAVVEWARSVSA